MAWTYNPTPRVDIPFEGYFLLSGGTYTGDWIATPEGADKLRVAVRFNAQGSPYVSLQHGIYDALPDVNLNEPGKVREDWLTVTDNGNYAYGEFPLVARYFRLVIQGGVTDANTWASLRSV